MTAEQNHLVAFVCLHFLGLVFTMSVGYLAALGLADLSAKRYSTIGRRGEVAAFLVVFAAFGGSLCVGIVLFGLEQLFAGPGYGDFLDACLLNHWLVSIFPAYAAFLRHGYVADWLDRTFSRLVVP